MLRGILTFRNGDIYNGQFQNNRVNGYGTMTRPSGEKYSGDLVNGRRHGYGQLLYPKQHPARRLKHEGTWRHGQMTGHGKIIWRNGDFYEGNFAANKISGFGVIKYAENNPKNLTSYSGEWRNDIFNGAGELEWTSGEKFSGNFLNGNMNGNGTYIWPDGRRYNGFMNGKTMNGFGIMNYAADDESYRVSYEGNWKDDNWNGYGQLILSFGDRYVGQFVDNEAEGKGTYFSAEGKKFVGEWKSGKIHGFGKLIFPPNNTKNFKTYEGEWKDNKKQGYGKLIWVSGEEYEGNFDNEVITGKGTFTWNDGRKYVGEFEDNNIRGQGSLFFPPNDRLGREKYVGEIKTKSPLEDIPSNTLKFEGFGTLHYLPENSNNLKMYEGDWKDDKKQGYGKLTWTSGEMYEGDFFNDAAHGSGTFVWADGRKFVGKFENNVNKGKGSIFFPPNDSSKRLKYIGQLKTNLSLEKRTFDDGSIIEGFGTFYWANGVKYVGYLSNNLPNGFGTTLSESSDILHQGQWKNGEFVE